MSEYKVGDLIEVVKSPTERRPVNVWEPSPDNPIWLKATVDTVADSGSVRVSKQLESDPDWDRIWSFWWIRPDRVHELIRRPVAVVEVATIPMATYCLECHIDFIYPAEYNVEKGRLCYSCNQTRRWKHA